MNANFTGADDLIRTTTLNGNPFVLLGVLTDDPHLGPLQNNGGLTPTMALADNSPAINAGDKYNTPATDQRGAPRDPFDTGAVDIGAYEAQPVAANMVVNTALDETTDTSTLSLREAINLATGLANGTVSINDLSAAQQPLVTFVHGDVSTITFASSILNGSANGTTLTLSTVGGDSVGPSAFQIASPIAIDGPTGNSGITLSAAGTQMRLFDVTSTGNLTLQDLTLSDGTADGFAGGNAANGGAGGGSAGLGGAIFNQGTLMILNSTLTGNLAQGGVGGSAQSGLTDDHGSGSGGGGLAGGDKADGYGGGPNYGVVAESPVPGNYINGGFGGGGGGGWGSVTNVSSGGNGGFGGGGGGGGHKSGSDLGGAGGAGGFGGGGGGTGGYGGGTGQDDGKAAGGGGGAGMGGAVFNEGGNVYITNSTFAYNKAYGGAGGSGPGFPYIAEGVGGTAGKGLGGGLFNHNGKVTVTSSTFSDNTAAQGGRDIFNLGDSTWNTTTSTTATNTINDTILAQADTNGQDFTGTTVGTGTNDASGRFDVIHTESDFSLAGGGVYRSNPDLGPLAPNGGPTPTMALLPNSIARVVGDNALAPPTDQRGVSRAGEADIGAYEFVAQQSQTITFNPLPNQTYGAADFALTATASSGLPVSYTATGDATVYQTNGNWFAHITGAGTATITASQAGNSSYSAATSVSQTFTIDPASLTVTASNQTMTYGGTVPSLTYTYTGLVNGDTSAPFTGSLATTATSSSNVGNYAITEGTLEATGNYTITTFNQGTLTVNPASISYTIGNDTQAYGHPANLAADLPSSFNTGINGETLDITYSSTGDTATATPGTYDITGKVSNGTGLATNYNVTLTPGTLTVLGSGVEIVGTTLWIVGGPCSNDRIDIDPVGCSRTGSTGIKVDANLNHVHTCTTYHQSFTAINILLYAGNDHVSVAPTLTIDTTVHAGNGNDKLQLDNATNTVTLGNGNDFVHLGDGNNTTLLGNGNDHVHAGDGTNAITAGKGNDDVRLGDGNNTVTLGNGNDDAHLGDGANAVMMGKGNDTIKLGKGNNVVTLGNGNDEVVAGNGNNTVTLGNGNDRVCLGDGANTVMVGNGNDHIHVGDGNNVIVEGNGRDDIDAGNGNNLIVAGLGRHTVDVGKGSNILIDGSVQLTQSSDSLRQVLDDWIEYGAQASNVASIRSHLRVTYNTHYANRLHAGSGLDWFWATDTQDHLNIKKTDLLN